MDRRRFLSRAAHPTYLTLTWEQEKNTCWSCLSLFTDSVVPQRTNFNQMSYFWMGNKEWQQETSRLLQSSFWPEGKVKKNSLKILCLYVTNLPLSNDIMKFRRSIVQRLLVALSQSRNTKWQPIDKMPLAMYWFSDFNGALLGFLLK